MPTSAREDALSAFYQRVSEIGNVRFVGRNVNHELSGEEIPALIVMDGGERARPEVSSTGELRIDTDVSVLIVARADDDTPIGPYINEWVARVREAISEDRTLGGGLRTNPPLTEDVASEDGGISMSGGAAGVLASRLSTPDAGV